MEEFDVVIIGAGLAGLQCARLLSSSGLRVLLADRKATLSHSIHTTGIFVRRTLEDFAIPEDCLGPAVRDVTLYSPARRPLQLSSAKDEFRIGRMGLLYQRFLEQSLENGVEWMSATRYAGLSTLKSHLVIRLDSNQSSRWIKARYLVGADGANSRVGRDLNLDRNRDWIVGVEDVCKALRPKGEPRLHCFLDREFAPGYLAWIADDGQEVHVGIGGYPAMFDPVTALGRFKDSVGDVLSLDSYKWLERRGGRIPVGGVLQRIANKQGLLVGDAAGAVSPLTAGGLDPCMRLSTLAAQVIRNYLATNDPANLAAYSGDLFRARFSSRIWMRRLVSNLNQPALELGCAALRLPIFKSFANHVFFGRGSFPVEKQDFDCLTAQATSMSVATHILR